MPDPLIRPRFRLAFPRRTVVTLGPLLATVWLTSRQSLEHLLGTAALGLALGSTFVAYAWALSRRSRLGLRGDGALIYRGLVRETVIADHGEAIAVVRVLREPGGIWWQVWSGPRETRVFDERAWPAAGLARLADQTAAEITEDRDGLDLSAFTRRYPSALPVYARSPVALGLVMFLVIVLALAALGDYS